MVGCEGRGEKGRGRGEGKEGGGQEGRRGGGEEGRRGSVLNHLSELAPTSSCLLHR